MIPSKAIKHNVRIGAVLVAAALALAARAHAQETFSVQLTGPGHALFAGTGIGPLGGPMMGDGPAAVLPLLMMSSDLSEAQHAQVRKIMEDQRATLEPLFQSLSALNQQLSDQLLSASDLQQDDVATLVQQIAGVRETLIQNGVKVALQVRGVLTPEQLAKAAGARKRLEALDAERRKILGDDVLFLRN